MTAEATVLTWERAEVGDALAETSFGPIRRSTLALFAGASGDHNPVHIDVDFARDAGLEDVFAHGMLVMAYLGNALAGWVPPLALREFGGRFVAITRIGDRIRCQGKVAEKVERDGERLLRLELVACDQRDGVKFKGDAWVCLGPRDAPRDTAGDGGTGDSRR